MGLKISGIAAAENLDSSGEILSLKGLDVSSLHTLNFEHESKQASQIVGKILEGKKIFTEDDCETADQLKFWNRIKIPYLYIIGELFDDVGHSGAMDLAALALYDQNNQDKYDFRKTFPLIGFSVEGSKINKEQNVITHSLARKISITITPCNKVCWGEIYQESQEQQAPVNKKEKISKARNLLQKMLKSEEISFEQEELIKSDLDSMEKVHPITSVQGISDLGIEARRGDVRKPGTISHGFGRVTSPETHMGRAKKIAAHSLEQVRKQPKPSLPKSEELIGGKGDDKSLSSFNPKEVKMGRIVEKEHTKYPKVAGEITADHLTEDPHYYSKLKDAGLADELEKTNTPSWSSRRAVQPIHKEESKPQWSSRRAVNSMQKALTATASPLNPEILEPKMQKITKSLELKKSEAVDVSIPTWGLVEKFKEFIKERVPSLTDKEANAFTRAFKIFKIKAAEKKLKDL